METQPRMEVVAKVNNGQSVYIVHETPEYYLVSLNADGSKRFKADKPRPIKKGEGIKEAPAVSKETA
jgi:hypothetical protein